MKTSELYGNALRLAVAKAERYTFKDNGEILKCYRAGKFYWDWNPEDPTDCASYAPDLHWTQGGPIIERENISTNPTPTGSWCEEKWMATDSTGLVTEYGNTLLIAAMRCYIASKLGDTIDIPEEYLHD